MMIGRASLRYLMRSSYNCQRHYAPHQQLLSISNPLQRFSSTLDRVLPYIPASYDSAEIIVDDNLVEDSSEFSVRLWITINELRSLKKNALYLKIPMSSGHFIPIAGQCGFKFHNAEGNFATLLLWLPKSECKVPHFATVSRLLNHLNPRNNFPPPFLLHFFFF